jgi:MtN3 and saliva related transmembrane protein
MQYIGFLAGALTTAAFVPQVWKSWRSRSVDDFSTGMLLLFNLGVALWIFYGWRTGALPVVVANAVTLALTIPLLVLKLRSLRS